MSTHLLILKRKKQKKKPPEAVERRDKPCKDVGRAGEGIGVTTRIGQGAWRVRIMKQERIRSRRRRFRVFRRRLEIKLRKKICSWLENEGPQRLKQKIIAEVKEITAGIVFGLVFGSVIVGAILIYCRMAGPF